MPAKPARGAALVIAVLLVLVVALVVLGGSGRLGPRTAAATRRGVRWGARFALAGLVLGIGAPRLLLPGSDDAALAGVVLVPVAALLGALYGAVGALVRGDRNDA